MTTQLTRRDFLRASVLSATALVGGLGVPSFGAQASTKRWYKGNLHMHNQWSDGNVLPEVAVDWYKSHGYNFICPSDHNTFQSADLRFQSFGSHPKMTEEMTKEFEGETSLWKPISCDAVVNKLDRKFVVAAQEQFGKDAIAIREVGGLTFVRMKPFDELVEQFATGGSFLMIPGFEQTGSVVDGRAVHMNFIGVRQTFPYLKGIEEPVDALRQTFAKGAQVYEGQKYIFTADHPMWRYYDYSPSALIENPQIGIVELINNGIFREYKQHPQGWKPEHFWDVVNAYRASHDQALIWTMGSDDRHDYDVPAKGWTMVRAEELSQDAILDAITRGDMYSSNGLDFEEIEFDGKTLNVKIDPHEDGPYRIDFIGTKKDYDPTCKLLNVEPEQGVSPKRVVETYSDQIGVVLETAEGLEASYTLKPDDLYVRAKIYKADADASKEWKVKPAAWTQAYR
ncbi:MAG: twin-arginine translocation signal domain-containing protein [Planctomycetia bacterium]|nr:twin-arginine translocation signal domain-containing protein [Planctomycetia bacterium]